MHAISCDVVVPSAAGIVDLVLVDDACNLASPLDKLQSQALRCMPTDLIPTISEQDSHLLLSAMIAAKVDLHGSEATKYPGCP